MWATIDATPGVGLLLIAASLGAAAGMFALALCVAAKEE